MTIEEIRKNAPDGATHTGKNDYYFKFNDCGWFIFSKTGFGWSDEPAKLDGYSIKYYELKPLF